MEKVRIYIRICGMLLMFAISWGYTAPILISSKSDFLVILGTLVLLSTPLAGWYIIKPIFKKNKTEKNEK